MSRTPCNAVADHQGATDPRLKTPGVEHLATVEEESWLLLIQPGLFVNLIFYQEDGLTLFQCTTMKKKNQQNGVCLGVVDQDQGQIILRVTWQVVWSYYILMTEGKLFWNTLFEAHKRFPVLSSVIITVDVQWFNSVMWPSWVSSLVSEL